MANSFYGSEAGLSNTTGNYNAFFARSAGKANETGDMNAFFGYQAGNANLTGFDNSFVGAQAGSSNTTGYYNSFFGTLAGSANTEGKWNSFIGRIAGMDNTTGNSNTFVGYYSGNGNTVESYNTFAGYYAAAAAGVSHSTALGNRAKVTQSNSLVLGSINGVNGATADTKVGIGTTSPGAVLHLANSASPSLRLESTGASAGTWDIKVSENSANDFVIKNAKSGATPFTILGAGNIGMGTLSPQTVLDVAGFARFEGFYTDRISGDLRNYFQLVSRRADVGSNYGNPLGNGAQEITSVGGTGLIIGTYSNTPLVIGTKNTERLRIDTSGNVGIGTTNPTAALHVIGKVVATGGFDTASDARLKRDITPLSYGLSEILKMRPVSYKLKDAKDNKTNLGLIAQELETITPEIVDRSTDEAGTLAMNYSGSVPILIRAVQEQQSTIQNLETALEQRNQENASLNARLSALEEVMERLTKLGTLK